MKSDPRLHVRYGGYNVLMEIVPSTSVAYTSAPNDRCATFNRLEQGPRRFDFTSYGAASVSIDDHVFAATDGTRALLSRTIPITIPIGVHRVAIRTCPTGNYNGYYFIPR